MKAIILAAGRGQRMGKLSKNKPKCLIELCSRPLIAWQIDALRAAGVDDLGLVTGYCQDSLSAFDLPKFHNPRWAETNMVSSLACAADWLREGPCIVSYSDIFFNQSAIDSLVQCKSDLAVTYDPAWLQLWSQRFEEPLLDAETFRLNSDGSLAEIGSRAKDTATIEGQYMGLLRVSPKAWMEIEVIRQDLSSQERDRLDMTTLLQEIVLRKVVRIDCVRYEGIWGEIDSPSDIRIYESPAFGLQPIPH